MLSEEDRMLAVECIMVGANVSRQVAEVVRDQLIDNRFSIVRTSVLEDLGVI